MMFATSVLERWIGAFDCCPWQAHAGGSAVNWRHRKTSSDGCLYSAEQRKRRDTSKWTLVQGILAPLQFAVFLVSLYLVLRYLMTGEGLAIATASIVIKTFVLYTIMITGSLWERDVFGRYLFARAFFWEDVVSMLVLALHTAYIAALLIGEMDATRLMYLALAAYAAYLVNAAQFVVKLQIARRERVQHQRPENGYLRLVE